jgi:hypothetical protein
MVGPTSADAVPLVFYLTVTGIGHSRSVTAGLLP